MDLETAKQVEVAQDTYQMRTGDIAGAWSPDSKWLAYSKVLPNELSAIHLYSLADAKSTQVTDGLSDATNPVFDKDGKYLYFTASTNSGEGLGLDIHAVGRTSSSSIYLAVLDKTQPSPFAPESDEEKAAEDKKPRRSRTRTRRGSRSPSPGAIAGRQNRPRRLRSAHSLLTHAGATLHRAPDRQSRHAARPRSRPARCSRARLVHRYDLKTA